MPVLKEPTWAMRAEAAAPFGEKNPDSVFRVTAEGRLRALDAKRALEAKRALDTKPALQSDEAGEL